MSTTYTLTVYSASENALIFADLDRSQLSRLKRAYNPQYEANYWVTGISIETACVLPKTSIKMSEMEKR